MASWFVTSTQSAASVTPTGPSLGFSETPTFTWAGTVPRVPKSRSVRFRAATPTVGESGRSGLYMAPRSKAKSVSASSRLSNGVNPSLARSTAVKVVWAPCRRAIFAFTPRARRPSGPKPCARPTTPTVSARASRSMRGFTRLWNSPSAFAWARTPKPKPGMTTFGKVFARSRKCSPTWARTTAVAVAMSSPSRS